MTPPELISLLQDFYRDTLDLFQRRQANAELVSTYDGNNVYQQVISRQETHLRWVSDAIGDLGGELSGSEPDPKAVSGDVAAVVGSDARGQQAFMNKWSARVDSVTNARHQKMLRLILGEMAEHGRGFEQLLEGRTDVLGRHADGKVLRGSVLPARPRN